MRNRQRNEDDDYDDDDGYEVSHVEVGGSQECMEKVENGNGAGVPLRQGDHLHHRQGDC